MNETRNDRGSEGALCPRCGHPSRVLSEEVVRSGLRQREGTKESYI